MKKLLFLYNPMAGTGKIRQRLGEIVERFSPFGYEVTLYATQSRGDATEYIARRGEEFDRIVCGGGDGTLNEVVAGLLKLENPPLLGYLPTGTTNDFSRTLKIPVQLMAAADCAMMGTPKAIDVGLFNGRSYIYVAAFGLFTGVSYSTPQNMKNTLGHLAYVLKGVAELTNIKPIHMKVEAEGWCVEDDFIYGMASDTVSVGGFRGIKADQVKADDGLFEVLLVRKPKTVNELNNIITALLTQTPNDFVMGFRANHIRFTSKQEVPWTLDGEFGGDHREVEINVLNRAVTIVTGEDVSEEILHLNESAEEE